METNEYVENAKYSDTFERGMRRDVEIHFTHVRDLNLRAGGLEVTNFHKDLAGYDTFGNLERGNKQFFFLGIRKRNINAGELCIVIAEPSLIRYKSIEFENENTARWESL